MWIIYIVCCADNTFYTGITNDVKQRIKEHNHSDKGAKYTRGRRPVRLVYQQIVKSKSKAARIEWRIKQMSRAEKRDLIKNKGKIIL